MYIIVTVVLQCEVTKKLIIVAFHNHFVNATSSRFLPILIHDAIHITVPAAIVYWTPGYITELFFSSINDFKRNKVLLITPWILQNIYTGLSLMIGILNDLTLKCKCWIMTSTITFRARYSAEKQLISTEAHSFLHFVINY